MSYSEKKEPRVFVAEHLVRGYELDANGHVNNAAYLNYAEFARWCMIAESAGSMQYFKINNANPVVVRVEIDYRAPLFLGDRVRIETRLVEKRSRAAVFTHVMKVGDRLAAEVRAVLVAVDQNGKAVLLPADFEEKFG